jgi:hypothetical protein
MGRKRITKAEQARQDAQRDELLAQFERWRDQVHGKTFDAKITAWDRLRGEGLVHVPAVNATFEIYACNIPGRKTWYPETACVFYERGQSVEIKFDVHLTRTFVLGVTPGTVDQERWDALDQSRLAFKCDESGQPVNGLFAKGAGL